MNISEIPPSARNLVKVYSERFALELLREAQIEAFRQNRSVEQQHIHKAWQRLRNETRNKYLKRVQESLIFFGGVLFSVLVQTLLTAPSDSVPIGQVIAGVLGLLLVSLGLVMDV